MWLEPLPNIWAHSERSVGRVKYLEQMSPHTRHTPPWRMMRAKNSSSWVRGNRSLYPPITSGS